MEREKTDDEMRGSARRSRDAKAILLAWAALGGRCVRFLFGALSRDEQPASNEQSMTLVPCDLSTSHPIAEFAVARHTSVWWATGHVVWLAARCSCYAPAPTRNLNRLKDKCFCPLLKEQKLSTVSRKAAELQKKKKGSRSKTPVPF